MPPPLPQQIRASHELGLMFQLNGGRALRGTLVAVVRSTVPLSFLGTKTKLSALKPTPSFLPSFIVSYLIVEISSEGETDRDD